jgi:hypothetical protein
MAARGVITLTAHLGPVVVGTVGLDPGAWIVLLSKRGKAPDDANPQQLPCRQGEEDDGAHDEADPQPASSLERSQAEGRRD